VKEEPTIDELMPAARNFTLSTAERVRGLEGLPAHLRRKKQIEQLWGAALAQLREVRRVGGDVIEKARAIDLTRLNDLIDRHNRYFPIEANLPIDPRSGGLLDGGRPWLPLVIVTAEVLVAEL
jgi:hypothetical protein